ncbi:endo-1,4-beta-xylanase [Cellulomonas wangsupingiae]|uniref:Beta-xylanase n=1 Tax=Cellulomonas wangsupingiae TaxID=2968085 RepID=A0ABY5K5N6_9CELL|nr:endo-1,4-beta-xylanase [Cellulomonas wangsupingiae]MCC2336518.1 endo-1,4-beta-xylanase [Cellulomonas wangsupingiae]UUI65762.1 endo-1,4-beta-xylanase [Cellulomonas wangsupingiae]
MIGTSLSSASAAAPPVVVVSANFDDGTLGQLQQSGNPTFEYVAEGAGRALSVSGRVNSWDGVSSAEGVFEAGTEYTLSARVRLPAGSAPTTAHFTGFNGVANPDGVYTWVGDTPVTADAWTTVTGTYTLPAGSVPAKSKVTLEVGGAAPWPAFLLDDVLVTRAAPTPPPTTTVVSANFDDGTLGQLQQSGNPTFEYVAEGAGRALSVSGRVNSWDGVSSAEGVLEAGTEYTLSARVRLPAGSAPTTAHFTGFNGVANPDGVYTWVGDTPVTADAWTTVTGTYTLPAGSVPAKSKVTLEVGGAAPWPAFLLDDVVVSRPGSSPGDGWAPDLTGFVPGGAVSPTASPVTTARTVEGATRTAALTFDDGPDGAHTDGLLDFLAANDVQATFCVIGQNVKASGGAALLRRIVSEGHAVCNHGTGYADMGGWTKAQVEADLRENLATIRTALGDPTAKVPYFRAPNGSWGQTAAVAVALGMQPLAVTNTIEDWSTQDEATLTANLRAAMKDGQVVLVHDGGGDRAASVAATRTVVAERLAAGWTFTLPTGGADGSYVPSRSIDADFEDGTSQGWSGRDVGNGPPTVEIVEPGHASRYAARISDRAGHGEGLIADVTGIFEGGATYDFSAWIKFEEGGTPGDVSLTADVDSSYPNLVQLTGMANDWVQVSGTFAMPPYTTSARLYFETHYAGGNTSTFLVDDITFTQRPDPVIQKDLPALFDSVDVPLGVAVDARETQRSAAELLNQHFEQVTAENSMKPENWYNGRTFAPNAQTEAMMDYAVANDLRVYGHVLVWHAQTPAWFFQDEASQPLPVNAASAEIVRQRMETHIENVAKWIHDEYGAFGSPTNPVVGWDVVNEVISDGSTPDGMRESPWHTYLGEEFVDRAFEYADKYVNDAYHAGGEAPRIALFINDYNSELTSKQDRYYRLVTDLIERGVPIDGVGHQFHVSLSLPVSLLDGALARFSGLGLQQAVTEFDVTAGATTDEELRHALFIEQGYYYRDAFKVFQKYEEQMFSITVWGLYDARSWRNADGGPLPFDEGMQAKPAYYGIVDAELPARVRTAHAFAGDVALDADATSDVAWQQLPLTLVDGEVAGFQARWSTDHLTVFVAAQDGYDTVEIQVGDKEYVIARDSSGTDRVVTDTADGWAAVVRLPVTVEQGDVVDFDLRAVEGDTVAGWNTPGHLGELRLVEPLSTVAVAKAASAPALDGEVDAVWQQAATVSTGKQVVGTAGAAATVRTLWQDNRLFVLADVVDPTVDAEDAFEIFLDAGNFKNVTYRYDDLHVGIDRSGTVAVLRGDQGFHANRVESEVVRTATGYRVEASFDMLDQYVGLGTFHGLDFQVTDAVDGEQVAAATWADPIGTGDESTQRWGVAQLVAAPTPPTEGVKPELWLSSSSVKPGGAVKVDLTGFMPGDTVTIALGNGVTAAGGLGGVGAAAVAPAGTTALGSVVVAADGTAALTVTVPLRTVAGTYLVVAAVEGEVVAEGALTVLAAAPAAPDAAAGRGALATTGTGVAPGLLGLLALLTGSVLVVVHHRLRPGSGVHRAPRR